ncbi:hypothetical protein HOY80DRAFT_1003141 [Tuber brumale]|nr:hypothetical protein HOY80DRAFT_1003141 [Tuber brumale]
MYPSFSPFFFFIAWTIVHIHSLVCIPSFRTPSSLFLAGGQAERDENPNVSNRLQGITNGPAWTNKLKMLYTLSLNLALANPLPIPLRAPYFMHLETSLQIIQQANSFLKLISYALPAKSSAQARPQFYGVVRYDKPTKTAISQ